MNPILVFFSKLGLWRSWLFCISHLERLVWWLARTKFHTQKEEPSQLSLGAGLLVTDLPGPSGSVMPLSLLWLNTDALCFESELEHCRPHLGFFLLCSWKMAQERCTCFLDLDCFSFPKRSRGLSKHLKQHSRGTQGRGWGQGRAELKGLAEEDGEGGRSHNAVCFWTDPLSSQSRPLPIQKALYRKHQMSLWS